MTSIPKILTLFLLITTISKVHAGKNTHLLKLNGNQIVNNASIEVVEDKFDFMQSNPTPGGWNNHFGQKAVNNIVNLKYTEASNSHYSSAWWVQVILDVERWDARTFPATALTTERCTLKVSYNPAAQSTYKDISSYINTDGYKCKVTVVNVSSSFLGNTVPTDVVLENVIEVERYYKLIQQLQIPITVNNSSPCTTNPYPDFIEFRWDYLTGANEYDLEWLFVSEYDVTALSNLDFTKATRITTSNQHYKVRLAFDKGYLLYRVRGVSVDVTDFKTRVEGAWSASNPAICVKNIDVNRNWTYNASFAENGKVKEVMTFFDGSQRNRQSVTLSNTENVALMTETVYDYEGRPAIQTMPAPAINYSSQLKFYQNLSLNQNVLPFSRKDFDNDVYNPTCSNTNISGMLSTNPSGNSLSNPTYNLGAAYYYSENNTAAANSGFNAAIPDADEFSFTQSVFTNDGSLKKQSGLGTAFKIGSNHETTYLNANASQEKLDRLFGNEVGYAEHYREKIVIDPNGQISVSYEDLSGKVIATAMRGNSPSNLEVLNNKGTSNDVDEQYMTPEIIKENFSGLNQYDPSDESYVTVKNLLVDNLTTTYKFSYKITPETFNSICNNKNYSCKYILSISVKDDCNNDIIPVFNTSINSANYSSSAFVHNFDVNFTKQGIYKIEKKLKLDPIAIQEYLADYIADLRNPLINTCAKKLTEFEAEFQEGIDFSECLSCEANCEQEAIALGYTEGSQNYLNHVEQCKQNNCEIGLEDIKRDCNALLQALKDDMSPGGQYFEYEIAAGTQIGSATFNTNTKYIDALLLVNNGNAIINFANCPFNYGALINATSYYQFLSDNWSDCFLNDLVQYHPEYCRYQRCVALQASEDYSNFIRNINYNAAAANSPNLTTSNHIATQDPFFTGVGNSYAAAINSQINNCTNCASMFTSPLFTAPSSGNSMWDWASVAPEPATTNDQRWKNFVSIYLNQKSLLDKNVGCAAIADNTIPPDNISNVNPAIISNTIGNTILLNNMAINDPDLMAPILAANTNPDPYIDIVNNNPDNCAYTQSYLILDTKRTWQRKEACENLQYDVNPITISSTNNECTINVYARIPAVPANHPFDETMVTGPNQFIKIATPFLLPQNWSNNGANTALTNSYLDLIVASINNYNSAPYDFTAQILNYQTTPNGDYEIKIIATNEFGQYGNQVYLKMVSICDGSVYELCTNSFSDATKQCPTDATNCICYQLNETKLVYYYQDPQTNQYVLADHNQYPTWQSFAVAKLTEAHGLTTPLTDSQIKFWAQNCEQNQNSSPLMLNEDGEEDIENEKNIEYAIPDKMACDYTEPCEQQGLDEADFYALEAFEKQITELTENFILNYKAACFGGNFSEKFMVEYDQIEYHYTLYYYDRAGNLVRTVPPKAVNRISASALYNSNNDNLVHLSRLANNSFIFPNHSIAAQSGSNLANTFVTNYKYNSYNQLVEQTTPDGGKSEFWYDDLGRLRFSRNAKQASQCIANLPSGGCQTPYSYTIYDAQGRITEVGENTQLALFNLPFYTNINNPNFPTANGTEVTKTYYDSPIITNPVLAQFTNGTPEFTRKRVVHTTFEEVEDNNDNTYFSATHYSYDVHGNVNELIQDIPFFAPINNQYKKIQYDYDLISGSVLNVKYQANKIDQFYHHYEYDANNRLTNAYTSNNNIHWMQDAKYFYYLHGPLARVEIGNEKVQNFDYAYTLQGWIKSVNSNNLTAGNDFGMDGYNNIAYNPQQNNLHKNAAIDVFGYSLHYFNGDYKSVNSSVANQITASLEGNTNLFSASNNLYNGNIKAMVTALYKPNGNSAPIQQDKVAKFFNYDQLNRITQAQSYISASFSGINKYSTPQSTDYYENFRYDENGNIKYLNRNAFTGSGHNNDMDEFKYHYIAGTNKLLSVEDNGDNANSTVNFDDIKNQYTNHPNNYGYDQIGNLTKDEQEEINSIQWSVYGKILSINRNATSTKPDLEFEYDASGQRIVKIVKPKTSTGAIKPFADWTITAYIRDAQGNVMALYETTPANRGDLFLKEHHIYGSSRLGVAEANINVQLPTAATNTIDCSKGDKQYELSNHLGNVLTVVSDRKILLVDNCEGLYFDGNDDCVNIPQNSNYNFGTGDFTIEARIKASSSQADSYPTIISNRNTATGFWTGFTFYFFNGHLNMYMNGTDGVVTSNTDIRDDTWHHVAITRSGTSVKLYLDGNNVSTGTNSGNISSSNPLWLGIEQFSTTLTKYTGNLNEVRLWNIARSNTDININKGSHLLGTETGLVGYWQMNEGIGQQLTDYSSVANNATVGNDNTSTSNDPAWQVIDCLPQANNITYFMPDILSATDYYSFGQSMPGRSFNGNDYRYGFNGKEKVDEISGSGNSIDFGDRMYDPRLGQWKSPDKLAGKYPYASPYNYCLNNPIYNIDPDGNSVAPGDQVAKNNFQARIGKVFEGELNYIAQKISYTTVGMVKVNGKDIEVKAFTFTGDINTAKNLIKNSSLKTKEKLVALTYLSTVSTNNVLNIQSPTNASNTKEQDLKIYSEKYKNESQDYINNPQQNSGYGTDYFANDKENGKVPTTTNGNEISGTRNTDATPNDLDNAVREFSQKLNGLDTQVKIETRDNSDGKIKTLDSDGNVQEKAPKK